MTVSLTALRSEAVVAGLEAGVPGLPADATPDYLLSYDNATGTLGKTAPSPSGIYYAATLGVVGNGADCTAALAAALAALPAGAELRFGAGDYGLTPPASGNAITLTQGITFRLDDGARFIRLGTGDYSSLFVAPSKISRFHFFGGEVDQRATSDTTCDVRGAAGAVQFIFDINADDIWIEGVRIRYCGINAIVSRNATPANSKLRVLNCDFHFERATYSDLYDNTAIYSQNEMAIVSGNTAVADAITGVWALGFCELHANMGICTNNIVSKFASVASVAVVTGNGPEAGIILCDNVAYDCAQGLHFWAYSQDCSLVRIDGNVLHVAQEDWKLSSWFGIGAGAGTFALETLSICNNVLKFQQVDAPRTIVDPFNGLGEQEYGCAGIGLLTDGMKIRRGRVAGNVIDTCPFSGIALGGTLSTTVLDTVQIANNLLFNCGHYQSAGLNDYRSFIRLRGLVTAVYLGPNKLRETFAAERAIYRIRAFNGTFTGCISENNHYDYAEAAGFNVSTYSYASTGWERKPLIRSSRFAWDPANIATGTVVATAVVIKDASPEHPCIGSHNGANAQGAGRSWRAYCSAPHTVQLEFRNDSGADINVGGGTATVHVFQES
jgi:hypothetical protein